MASLIRSHLNNRYSLGNHITRGLEQIRQRNGEASATKFGIEVTEKKAIQKMSLSCILEKNSKKEHTFLVFLFIFVNNILLEIISKHIMASNKNKGYNMRKMNVL